MSRIFNFNAGPAALPLEVLEEVQAELLDFNNTGMSILEISHRSPAFEKVLEETKQDIKDLLNLPDDYGIFFMGGGGSLQFSCVPCNFLKEGMSCPKTARTCTLPATIPLKARSILPIRKRETCP